VTDSRSHKSKTLRIMSITMFLSGCGQQFILKQDPARIYTSETHVEVSHVNVGSRVTLTPEILDLAELGCRANGFAAEYRGLYRNNEYSGEEVFTFNCVLPQNKTPTYFEREEEWLLAEKALADRNNAIVQKTPKASSDTASSSSANTQIVESPDLEFMRKRLIQLEAEKDATRQAISQDTQSPLIRITSADSNGARGNISGIASDNTGIAEVLIDGQAVPVDSSGQFSTSTFIPSGGIDIQVTAYDLKGLSTTETIRLERSKRTQTVSRLAAVNPLVGPKQKSSRDRAALIIGLEQYAAAPPADYASRDAQMFADYAREKLGIAPGNIKVLTDTEATRSGLLRALKVWLLQAVQPDKTDLYVFYAGHGMASDDGESAYIVPYGADTFLLEDTAISRERFYEEIGAAKPRTATFFFDNCYAGTTRSEERLLAQRPLSIKVQESPVPDNYLVFTAGESNQTAGVLDEVKHGRFSYFVFKGLEGEADANQDGKISAGELHAYVRESVGRFSAGAQTPTMLGDAGRWVLG